MPRVQELFRRAIQLGPRSTLERGWIFAGRKFAHAHQRLRDAIAPTFSERPHAESGLLQYVRQAPVLDVSAWQQLKPIVELYCQHRFDLLGSGWCQVRHGMRCQGVEGNRYDSGPPVDPDRQGEWLRGRINRANLRAAKRIWSAIEGPYQPIDWQLDFKSGYRWSQRCWHVATPIGHLPGVDVKVPWELSRMQHLCQMALGSAAARRFERDKSLAVRLEVEFRNQVIDFIACNPPRFGVNWRCPMDVAIRAANWLLAYDMFKAAGMEGNPVFDSIFAESIALHGQHIIENLEWQRMHRGNHYLADITGLLFIAAYLPCSPRTDAWLAFAVRQFVAELSRQFTSDGANFEASTSYHRLSAEMAVFGTAIILALGDGKLAALSSYDHRFIRRSPGLEPSPVPDFPLPGTTSQTPIPPECWDRICRMAEFSRDVTKTDGVVHQVGDNDSGRFFKVWPVVTRSSVAEARSRYRNLAHFSELNDCDVYWQENYLDHRSTIAAAATLVGRDDLLAFAGVGWPEADVINQLVGNGAKNVAPQTARNVAGTVRVGDDETWRREINRLSTDRVLSSQHCSIQLPRGATDDMIPMAYPDFGLFLWRGPRLYLAVRCGPVGQEGNGGHAHNDQLAIELQVDNVDWIVDAGTYLYTSDSALRNAYRSVESHFAPHVEPPREPGRIDISLFQLPEAAHAECLYFSRQGFIGAHRGFGPVVTRLVTVSTDAIEICDYAPRSLNLRPLVSRIASLPPTVLPFSPGYGVARAA